MKSLRPLLTKAIFLFSVIFISSSIITASYAQDDDGGGILSMTEFTVKPGHDFQFREGVKAWKDCYLENEGDWTWTIWHRLQGDGNVYVLTSWMDKWAEFDESDPAGKECRDIARELINPHIESSSYNLAWYMNDLSIQEDIDFDVVWVNYWTVKNSQKFMAVVREVEGVLKEVEGDSRGFWYNVMGGEPGTPDYFVVDPYQNFAAMDEDTDGVWSVVEKAKGEGKKDELRAAMREATDEYWSFVFNRIKELSHDGGHE